MTTHLRLPAIEIDQGGGQRVYTFAVDAKLIPSFAAIHRAARANDGRTLVGYQRPEVVKHIRAIADYIESDRPMIPNALTISFDASVTFHPHDVEGPVGYARTGDLVVPVPADPHLRPGHLVDGQQRTAAVREAKIDTFPLACCAFITDDEAVAREQFLLVNNTKPLPKGLIHELLPGTTTKLPRVLERKRYPAELVAELNLQPWSPLHDRIRTATRPDGFIKDNSVLRMLENSLTDGALYRYRDPHTGQGDTDAIIELVTNFFSAVATVWPDAWDAPPRKSRLVHGAGIIALGFLMDTICDMAVDPGTIPSTSQFTQELRRVVPHCAWMSGHWRFGPDQVRAWNEVQNTSKDQQVLANHLIRHYAAAVRNESAGQIHPNAA
jgi:DGQHR domain-containing protein